MEKAAEQDKFKIKTLRQTTIYKCTFIWNADVNEAGVFILAETKKESYWLRKVQTVEKYKPNCD